MSESRAPTHGRQQLLVSVGGRVCGLQLRDVIETLRPLAIEPVAGAPTFVAGVAVIRGVPTPVVDLLALLEGGPAGHRIARLVTVKVGAQQVALGVDAVTGLTNVDAALLEQLPPLLRDTGVIEAIGAADARLLVVLRAARLVPAELWATLASAQAAR